MPHTASSAEPVVAIVVAAGSGTRLGGDVPKALRQVGGVPLVSRSVAQLAAGGCTYAFVVIAPELRPDFEAVLSDADVPVTLVAGGTERQDSVRRGLAALEDAPDLAGARVVLIHDAARALVPAAVVARVIAAVQAGADAVIPVIPVIDTVRQINQVGSSVIDRATLRAVQTPQGFDRATVVEAHRLIADHGVDVTDDAAACEFAGSTVTLVEGSRDSLKITEPVDLVLAEAIVAGA